MKKLLFTGLTLLFTQCIYSQDNKRTTFWFFGDQAGLDFTSGAAVPIKGPMWSYEGCAAMSDTNGNLLYYTNGGPRNDISCSPWMSDGGIWNRNHVFMNGGMILNYQGGGTSSSQSCVTIPSPGSNTNYYVFTTPQTEYWLGGGCYWDSSGMSFSYYEIDMSQNGGLGKVVKANQKLWPALCGEWLGATVHGNGTDFWVLTCGKNDTVYEYLVSDSGIELVDSIGGLDQGDIVFSPDGTWTVIENFLCEFDNMTGAVSNPIYLGGTGCPEFSPNSEFLYCARARNLYRYDLTATDILASKDTLIALPPFSEWFDYLQLGPDGKIYVAHGEETTKMDIIHCPNNRDTSMINFEFDAFSLLPGTEMENCLPNFVDA